MNEMNNKLSTEQLNKMSVEEILAFNGFEDVNNELSRLGETKGSISSLASCVTLTLTALPAAFTASITNGSISVPVGTTSVTYTVLVTNTGGTAGGTTITLYDATIPTVPIAQPGTSSIAPGGSQTLSIPFNPSTWIAGNYSICVRVGT